jgi:hypothetical protein
VSTEYIPAEAEPAPYKILQALPKALDDNSSLKRASAEEITKQINTGGYLEEKAKPSLVAEMPNIMRAGGPGLRSPVLQPCSLELFWDADAGQISDGIDLGLNLGERRWYLLPDLAHGAGSQGRLGLAGG